MLQIHNVLESELPQLLQWLEDHLPLTWKLYGTLREQMRGKWQGTTFCTLGWPDILAVGEGPIDKDLCKVMGHYTDPRRTTIFAPKPDHAHMLLTWPGFLDWSQPIIFHNIYIDGSEKGTSQLKVPSISIQLFVEGNRLLPLLALPVASIIRTLSQQARCSSPRCIPLTLMTANVGDISYRLKDPEDLIVRTLGSDGDAEFVLANWEYAGKHTRSYVQELLKCFPSMGVFTRDGTCFATEMGTEWGFIGMLYVSPEARGRGLGKLLTCRLADKYFEAGLPAVVVTSVDNTQSISLHESLGFKQMCNLTLIYHTPDVNAHP